MNYYYSHAYFNKLNKLCAKEFTDNIKSVFSILVKLTSPFASVNI